VPTQETEEEYDARLEREELERIEAQRKKDLERLKERYEREIQNNNGGVRLKGRGRMMYVDPGAFFFSCLACPVDLAEHHYRNKLKTVAEAQGSL
jgi:hypothetical protein